MIDYSQSDFTMWQAEREAMRKELQSLSEGLDYYEEVVLLRLENERLRTALAKQS